METYATSFEVMTGSAEKATAVMDELKRIGAETPFEFEDLAKATQTLMAFGFEADEAVDQFTILGDIAQGDSQKLDTFSRALGKMQASGKVSLESINMMIEQGFNPLQVISEQTGESMSNLYDRVSAGTLTLDEVKNAMVVATSEGGQFFQSMSKQSETFNGKLSTLQDNFQAFTGEIFESATDSASGVIDLAIGWVDVLSTAFAEGGTEGLIGAMGDILTDAVGRIVEFSPYIIELAIAIVGELGAAIVDNAPIIMDSVGEIVKSVLDGIGELVPELKPLTDVLSALIDNMDAIMAIIVPLTAAFISWHAACSIVNTIDAVTKATKGMTLAQTAAKIAQELLNATMLKNPFVLVATLVAGLVAAIIYLWNTNEDFRNACIKIWNKVCDVFATAVDNIVTFFTKTIPNAFNDLVEWFEKLPETFVEIGTNIVAGIGKGILNGWDWLVGQVEDLASDLLGAVCDVLDINSPSGEFEWIADMCLAGYEKPMKKFNPYDTLQRSMKTNISGLQSTFVAHARFADAGTGIDYDAMADAVMSGIEAAGFVVKIGQREFGRIVREVG